jgi:hypothetical protein
VALRTAAQFYRALAGLIVPTSLRAWLRDLIDTITPEGAVMERATTYTIPVVDQTPTGIIFAGGTEYEIGTRVTANLLAGDLVVHGPGLFQMGAQGVVVVPVTTELVVQLYRDGAATPYRAEVSADNKALRVTIVITAIVQGVEGASTVFELRISRVAGTSAIELSTSTFYILTA